MIQSNAPTKGVAGTHGRWSSECFALPGCTTFSSAAGSQAQRTKRAHPARGSPRPHLSRFPRRPDRSNVRRRTRRPGL